MSLPGKLGVFLAVALGVLGMGARSVAAAGSAAREETSSSRAMPLGTSRHPGARSTSVPAIYNDSIGPPAPSAGSVRAADDSGLGFTPLAAPVRIADTREGADDPSTYAGDTLGAGGSLTVDMPSTVVPAGAGAVVAQLTAVDPTQAGYLSVYPAGGTNPGTANVNFDSGQTVGNLVTVGLGTDPRNGSAAVTVYNGPSGTTDLTFDLYGYYSPPSASSGDPYVPVTPSRIYDTRPGSGEPGQGQTLAGAKSVTVPVTGVGGVPSSGVSAVVVNIAVTDTTALSYLQAYPTGSPPSSAAPTVNQNWSAGETLSTKAVVGLGPGGSITLSNDEGDVDVIVDVDGYFLLPGGTGDLFTPLSEPQRLVDTRPEGVEEGQSSAAEIAGDDARAGVLNVADIATSANFLTVYPEGQSVPLASDVNYVPGDVDTTVDNASYGTTGSDGGIDIYNGGTANNVANIVVDEFGYFSPASNEAPGAPLEVTTTSLPSATLGTPYSATVSASGGTPPYSWSVATGSLPPGLNLSTGGDVSGSPTGQGNYSFTVQVVDSASPVSQAASASLEISVSGLPVQQTTSANWSGYAFTGGPFTEVSGTFTVPYLESYVPHSVASQWVGIDGFPSGNDSLIQAGVAEVAYGSTTYIVQPWWEILPSAETTITSMTVNPGDTVTVSIDELTSTQWSITVTDDTSSQTFTTDQSYDGPANSAEWIVEAPTEGISQTVLAPYTPDVSFTGIEVSGSESSLYEITMVQNGEQVSTPSGYTSSGFDVAYGDTAPPAPELRNNGGGYEQQRQLKGVPPSSSTPLPPIYEAPRLTGSRTGADAAVPG